MSKIKMNYFINTTLKKRWICGVAVVLLSTAGQSAIAANWYVDSAVGTSGNGQSWAGAFKTFSAISWSSINPGDTLYISGGSTSKTYSTPLTIGKSGTSSNRITVRVGQDAGHTGTVIFDGASVNVNQSYITIDGSVNGVSKLHIKNITDSSKDNGWAFNAGGSNGLILKYVTVTNCNNGVNLTYGNNYEISNSSMTTRGDAVIRGIMSNLNGWDVNKIHDNFLESLFNGGGPDTIQVGHSTSIYNNKIKVTKDSSALSGQHTDNLQLAGFNIKVYGNEFINIGDSNIDYDAWASGKVENVHIYNNLFHLVQDIDPYPDFIRIYSTGAAINSFNNVKILNNSFIDDRTSRAGTGQLIGYGFGNGSGAGSGNETRNNLVRGTPSGMSINMDRGGSSFSMAYSNNIYPYSVSRDPSAKVGVPALDANFIPTSSDTLARDKGMAMSFFSTDKRGTARPQGSAWDIGAFEYSGNSSTVSLLPPTNLRIQ
jgi:hypothetical protein